MYRAIAVVCVLLLGRPCAAANDEDRPVTPEEAQVFAELLQLMVNDVDGAALTAAIDEDALITEATRGLGLSLDDAHAILAEGELAAVYGQDLTDGLNGNGTSYRLVRVLMEEDEPRPLFRVLPNEGINYHELRLTRDKNGQPKIADILTYANGEWVSGTLRRSYLPYAIRQDFGVLETLPQTDRDYITSASKVNQCVVLSNQAKHDRSNRIIRSLPASLKSSRMLLVTRLENALGDGPHTIKQIISEAEQASSHDRSLDFLSMIYLNATDQHVEALDAINRFNRAIGDDPLLDVVRAEIHLEQGKQELAETLVDDAIDTLPDLDFLYFNKLQMALDLKDYAEVVRMIEHLEDQFGYEFINLEDDSGYADFMMSNEYRRWIRSRAQ